MPTPKEPYDFSGWVTKANVTCTDGRMIMRDAFKHNDGQIVPLVWNHSHNDPNNVLGHCLLENREDGVYGYCTFNDIESGKVAKQLVQHGDIEALSVCANKIKQHHNCVVHGNICEASLVLAGANPGAFIDSVMQHGEEVEDEAIIYTGEMITLYHSSDSKNTPEKEIPKEDDKMADDEKKTDSEETVGDIWNTLSEKQKTVVYALIGQALDNKDNSDKKEGDDTEMKHNLFDNDKETGDWLNHSDEVNIINMAKSSSIGSLREAISIWMENNNGTLAHGIDSIEELFPEYTDVHPGAPELITNDQSWVSSVINKCEKSPISRIRTRQADARVKDIRGSGYTKGDKKKETGNVKLITRTTDPQTVYVKDELKRDDIVDITDFDVVEYQYKTMRMALNEELAIAILIGDGRDDGDDQKISEEHIRSIWHDDDLYTIHTDVDIAKAKSELQGTNTGANFGDNYVYAEAIIEASLHSREHYKGSGSLDLLCTPHLLNVMLLARDLNGRRIYESKNDLAAALNVNNIYTVEQFEGRTRKTSDNKTKKLLGLFVNFKDYRLGSTKKGEITRFDDFDIDFNQYKYLMETRLSGALTRVHSAIALEEPVSGSDASELGS